MGTRCWVALMAVLLLPGPAKALEVLGGAPPERAGTARPAPASGAAEERRLTLKVQDEGLRSVLKQIFEGSGLSYSIARDVPNVPITLNVRDVALASLLRVVIKIGSSQVPGLSLRRVDGVYQIAVRPDAVERDPFDPAPRPADAQRTISLTLREAPLRKAVDRIFFGSGLQYAVDPTVPDVPITLNIRDVALPSALRTLVKIASSQVPGLTQERDGDVYVIKIRRPSIRPAEPLAPEDPRLTAPPPPGDQVTGEELWEKIPLLFVDATELARSLGASVVGNEAEARRRFRLGTDGRPADTIFVPGDRNAAMLPNDIQAIVGLKAENALLVRGTAEDLQALKQIVRLLDVPQRQIRVRVSAGALAAEGIGLNGAPLRLSDAAGRDRLELRVTPRLNGDNSVDLAIEGTLVREGVSQPVASHLRTEAGKAVQVMTLGQGARELRLWLRAVPLAEPGDRPAARPGR